MGDRAPAVMAERIHRLCLEPESDRALRIALLAEIRRSVGFDAYAWLLTDPETEVGTSPLADVPGLDELPRLIRAKYLTTVNRWTHMKRPVERLRDATNDDPGRSLVWQTCQRFHRVGDVASLVFRDDYGCWAFLDLWRFGTTARFSEPEADQLTRIAPLIAWGLRRSLASTFAPITPTPQADGPIVLVLSPELQVRAQTTHTEQYLTMLLPPELDHRPIPAAVYNVAAQLLALEAGVDSHPATARVHIPTRGWFTLRADRMDKPPAGDTDIAVAIEPTPPHERLPLFARVAGFTTRERTLLGELATGAGTRQIADQMYLSEHTVQDHLKSMFDKTGCRSRRTLLATALGN